MLDRIRLERLKEKVTTAEEAVKLIEDGMVVGSSGFTKAGDSKVILPALAERAKKENIKITLMTGASLGHGTDGKLAEAGALKKRMPFQVDPVLRSKINNGEVLFIDQHLSESAELLHNKNLPDVDIAVLEVAYIDRDGSVVPTTSVGNSVTFAALAKKVILEINTSVHENVYGIHDIYQAEDYPHRNVIPIVAPWNKIGRKTIPLNPDKGRADDFPSGALHEFRGGFRRTAGCDDGDVGPLRAVMMDGEPITGKRDRYNLGAERRRFDDRDAALRQRSARCRRRLFRNQQRQASAGADRNGQATH